MSHLVNEECKKLKGAKTKVWPNYFAFRFFLLSNQTAKPKNKIKLAKTKVNWIQNLGNLDNKTDNEFNSKNSILQRKNSKAWVKLKREAELNDSSANNYAPFDW